jgi:hypothetical protein
MAYIGKSIESGTFSVLDTSGNTYNGSNTTFSLGTQVGSPAQLLVSHDGVIQKPGTDYSLASGGTQITFSTAPASGASIFIVEISGAVGGPLDSDLNGTELILDTDGDTSIHADTDDRIDIKIAGADDFKFTANNMNVLSGSTLTIDSGATITNSGTANGFGTDPDGAQVFNESGAAVDFRVESDNNANMLVVDGSTDCVAIGQAAGDSNFELDIAGDIRLYNSGDGFEAINWDSNRGSNGDFLGDLTAAWNGTEVCRFAFRAGDDTTNKDNGFFTWELAAAGSLSEKARLTNTGSLGVGQTGDDGSALTGGGDLGCIINGANSAKQTAFAFQNDGIVVNRSEGNNNNYSMIDFYRNGSNSGGISSSNTTVTYGTFCGVHYAQLTDDSKPDILVGTVLESINGTCEWHMAQFTVPEHKDDNGETVPETVKKRYIPKTNNVGDNIKFKWHKNYKEGDAGFDANAVEYDAVVIKENDEEYLARVKVSDTEDSKAVYGVFESWMESEANDMQVASLGAFMIRVHKDETVAIGDYLQSKGDGTAKVQADDILRASTIAKVVKTNKIKTYADGSYLVSCTLHCG